MASIGPSDLSWMLPPVPKMHAGKKTRLKPEPNGIVKTYSCDVKRQKVLPVYRHDPADAVRSRASLPPVLRQKKGIWQ